MSVCLLFRYFCSGFVRYRCDTVAQWKALLPQSSECTVSALYDQYFPSYDRLNQSSQSKLIACIISCLLTNTPILEKLCHSPFVCNVWYYLYVLILLFLIYICNECICNILLMLLKYVYVSAIGLYIILYFLLLINISFWWWLWWWTFQTVSYWYNHF